MKNSLTPGWQMRSWKSWLPGAMKPALTVGSHSKSLAYDPVFEPMLAFMNQCKHFVIQKIALPCLDKALTNQTDFEGRLKVSGF